MSFSSADHPHRRFDPLAGEWVLVSPHRSKRPWLGQVDPVVPDHALSHDPDCYLCPGNRRVTGETNPAYVGPFVFANDFAAIGADLPQPPQQEPSRQLFRVGRAQGECRVICFSEDHAKTLPDLDGAEMAALIACWQRETASLSARWTYAQLFENKGAMMGCSNPHPHGQIWASDFIPSVVAAEVNTQADWLSDTGQSMLVSLAEQEAAQSDRVVVANDEWIAVVPFWARWPFETLVLPRHPVARLPDLSDSATGLLGPLLSELTRRYDNLFQCSFPYSMGWHGAPRGLETGDGFQLHAHFYPPLLRSATVRKFMVGYEMLGEAQRDLTPEQAAERRCPNAPRPYCRLAFL